MSQGSSERRETPVLIALASAGPGAGKTTAERHLVARGFAPIRIGDAVKRELTAMTAVHGVVYDERRKESFRALLSTWSEFRVATEGEAYWIDLAMRDAPPGSVVVSDVRYPAELQWCRSKNAFTIFVTRAGLATSPLASEGRLTPDDFDCTVCNDADDGGAAMFAEIDAVLTGHFHK